MAKGAVASYAAHMGGRLKGGDDLQIAEQSTTLARLAEAAADVDAAIALVLADATMVDSAKEPSDVSPLERARIPRDWAYAAQKARYAVTRLFEASGGGSIYDDSAFQRIWRDVNSAAQHFAFGWDSAMTSYGRASAGLKQSTFMLKKKS